MQKSRAFAQTIATRIIRTNARKTERNFLGIPAQGWSSSGGARTHTHTRTDARTQTHGNQSTLHIALRQAHWFSRLVYSGMNATIQIASGFCLPVLTASNVNGRQ